MSEIKRFNEDPAFMHYMTKEEDDEKCRMTEIKEASDAGKDEGKREERFHIAKELLKLGFKPEEIAMATKLIKDDTE